MQFHLDISKRQVCFTSWLVDQRKTLSLEQRVDVLKGLDTGQSCRAVVSACGCGKEQTTRIRSERDAIMKEWQSGG